MYYFDEFLSSQNKRTTTKIKTLTAP
jgi:hypothetical protein